MPGQLLARDGARRRIDTPIGTLLCAVDGQPDVAAAEVGRKAFAVFRPEVIGIGTSDGAENHSAGEVTAINFAGATTVAEIAVGAGVERITLHVKLPSRVDGIAIQTGDRVTLNWSAKECRLVLA